jgi:hypothetical protein
MAVGLTALVSLGPMSLAQATLIGNASRPPPNGIGYSFQYSPPAGDTTYPSDSPLQGTLQFFSQPGPVQSNPGPSQCGAPIAIGAIAAGGAMGGRFQPTDPCFTDPTLQLSFTFSGQVQPGPNQAKPPPNGSPPVAFAFPFGTVSPASQPGPIQLPAVQLPAVQFGFDASGPIYGFHSPGVLIGTWNIFTTPVPEPPALPLFVFGLSLVALLRLRPARLFS